MIRMNPLTFLVARHCIFWLLFHLVHWSRMPQCADPDGRFWRFYLWLAGGCYSLDAMLYAHYHGQPT